MLVHPVVVAVEGERPVGAQQPLDDLHGLLEPLHPHPGRVIGEAGLLVVGLHPSGAQAHLEAAVAQHIEGGRLLGQDERIPVVVPEDQGAHPQRGGGGCRRGQGRRRGELVAEVVRHEESRVAQILGLACLFGPRARRAVGPLAQLGRETERVAISHGAIVPHIGSATPGVPDSVAAGVAPPAAGAAVVGVLGAHFAGAVGAFGEGP